MGRNKIEAYIVYKLLNRNFDMDLNTKISEYMSEGTILGNIARINLRLFGNNIINNARIQSNFDSWQFGGDDENE